MDLGITVTPKVHLFNNFQAHIVFQHIQEFLQLVNDDASLPDVGLGYFSEQAFESMHHDVKVSHKTQFETTELLCIRFCGTDSRLLWDIQTLLKN